MKRSAVAGITGATCETGHGGRPISEGGCPQFVNGAGNVLGVPGPGGGLQPRCRAVQGRSELRNGVRERFVPEQPSPWKMRWSIGLLGDFLWMNLPESRPFLAERIAAEVGEAIELDRELQPIQPMDTARDVLWYPLIQPALDARPRDEEWVARLLRVVREAWELEPPPWEDTRYGLRVYVLENLDVPDCLPVVERLEPALYAVIRSEIGS